MSRQRPGRGPAHWLMHYPRVPHYHTAADLPYPPPPVRRTRPPAAPWHNLPPYIPSPPPPPRAARPLGLSPPWDSLRLVPLSPQYGPVHRAPVPPPAPPQRAPSPPPPAPDSDSENWLLGLDAFTPSWDRIQGVEEARLNPRLDVPPTAPEDFDLQQAFNFFDTPHTTDTSDND
jgi:hypothetical protein